MIKEQVIWVESTRENAITLANDVGGNAEVHSLHIRKGTFEMAHKPVGYLVYQPPKWQGLTDEEIYEIYEATEKLVGEHWDNGGTILMFPTTLYQAIEAKLKEKNT